MKPKTCRHSAGISRIFLLGILAATSSARAQTNWNPAGDGTWNLETNWSAGIPDSETANATFSKNFTGSPIVTLDKEAGFTINRITYDDTGASGDSTLAINPGTGGKLILAGTTPTLTAAAPLSVSVALEGTAGLTKAGASSLTLSGANTYSGTTSITAGSLTVQGNHSGGGGWTVGVNAAASALTFAAGSTVSVGAGNSVVTVNGNGTVNAQRVISVSGSVTSSSTSNLQILGRNTVTIQSGGSWNMQGGTLTIRPNNTSYSAVLNVNSGSTFTYSGSNSIIVSKATTGNNGSGTLTLGGTFTTTTGFRNTGAGTGNGNSNFNFVGGTLKISNDITSLFSDDGQPFTINLGTGGGTIDTNGFNTATSLGISGTGGLTKDGAGSLTLAGSNSYQGLTSVTAGTLYVTGSLANSEVSVSANGTIGSNGLPGTLGNGLSLAEGASIDLTGATLGPSSTGILSLTGGSLTLGNLSFQNLIGWDWAAAEPGTYQIIDGTFGITWGDTAYLSPETAYDFNNGKKGYFEAGSLNVVIIPEPHAALLGGIGLLALLRRKRFA